MNDTDILITSLPNFDIKCSKVVLIFDKIRLELGINDEEFFEFCWFAREFPRYYRYHIENVKYRLQSIQKLYEHHKEKFLLQNNVLLEEENTFEKNISSKSSFNIYWDFEALLNATNSALDILARISGTAYLKQTPHTLNNMSKKKELDGIVDFFRIAKTEWINEMKNYRDCFVHHTPVDSQVYVTVYKLKKNWKMWCKIPTNPNILVSDGFIYSKRLDLLKYSISVYENLIQLDNQVANKIEELYLKGEFPKKTKKLFYSGYGNRD